MIYDNGSVRRQDRLMSEDEARGLLRSGEYGFLAMASAEGGYGIPVSYAAENDTIYIHCAPEGRKLRALEHDDRVTFCVVGATCVQPEKFTTAYESVMVHGRARVVESDDERRHALRLIAAKYSPQYAETGAKYIEKSFFRTAVIAVDGESFSGKAKRI